MIKNKIDLKHKFYILIHQNYHLLLEEIKEVINMGYIYKITNLVNKKPYVGKTVNTISTRWTKHKDEAFNQNSMSLIHCAMRKYGIENFIIEELEKCSDEFLNEREQYWIKTINWAICDIAANLSIIMPILIILANLVFVILILV